MLKLKNHSAGCQPISFSFSLVILLLCNRLTQASMEGCWLLIPFPKTSPPQGTLWMVGHHAAGLQGGAKRIRETSTLGKQPNNFGLERALSQAGYESAGMTRIPTPSSMPPLYPALLYHSSTNTDPFWLQQPWSLKSPQQILVLLLAGSRRLGLCKPFVTLSDVCLCLNKLHLAYNVDFLTFNTCPIASNIYLHEAPLTDPEGTSLPSCA